MSLESALEEERLEILKLLERPPASSAGSQRYGVSSSSSPTLPRSPPLVPRTTSPSRGRSPSNGPPIPGISSMILAAESSSPSSSPPPSKQASRSRSRETSPSIYSPGGPQRLQSLTPNADYQFSMISSLPPPSSIGMRRPSAGPPSKPFQSGSSPGASPTLAHAHLSSGYQETLASIYSESGPFQPGGMGMPPGAADHASSIWKSKNPSNRRSASPYSGNRSSSPGSSLLSPLSPPPTAGFSSPGMSNRHILTQNDIVVDLDHAYRRLSDEALARSGGTLSMLPARGGQAAHVRANSGESVTRDGGIRLEKDLNFVVGEDGREVAVESSDDSAESSDDDPDMRRGRKESGINTTTSIDAIGTKIDGLDKLRRQKNAKVSELNKDTAPRKTMSLLAAAEEERKSISSRYHVSSLLTPSVMVSPPNLTQANTAKNYIHPNTNFDLASHTSTPISSDAEADAKDLRKAQRMSLNMSSIISTPETNRTVRTITRGDYDAIKDEPTNARRKQKSYLVATDLSAEAAHALEWTIGTVLRDGDTLLAIYAIDEETASENQAPAGKVDGGSGSMLDHGNPISEDRGGVSSVLLDQSREEFTSSVNQIVSVSEAGGTTVKLDTPDETKSPSRSVDVAPVGSSPLAASSVEEPATETSRTRSKSEQERWSATQSITAIVTKLLRRTRLQVNVVVEVIHCKSPKHLLTEMIDVLEPTLVILGSRGRSALKGVLLGSFSNYLVTKSSVPVMVARKKLKKTKYRKTNVRLANNLTSPLGYRGVALADAKID